MMRGLLYRLVNAVVPGAAVPIASMRILARDFGQLQSARTHRPVDAEGRPVPWYTYPAIDYLNQFDFRKTDVFEFGSGNSSRYWASHARSVVSVEADKDWFGEVQKEAAANQTVLWRPDEAGYVGSIAEQGRKFGIVVVDGLWRGACVREALQYLEEGGLIILDNSDRAEERESCAYLRELSWMQVDFSGFGPINSYCWTTSLFFKDIAAMQKSFSGPFPTAGLKE